MKKSFLPLIPALAVAAIMIGCGGGKEESKPVTVTSYETYTDPAYKFGIRYPADWTKAIQPGLRAVFYSSQAVSDGFTLFEPKGNMGAKIEVYSMPGNEQTMSSIIDTLRTLFNDPNIVKAPEQTTLNGMPATKVSYSFPIEGETMFTAERLFVVKDSMVSFIETAVIGTYGNYTAVFDSARAGFRPGVRPSMPSAPTPGDTTGEVRDSIIVDPPSAETKPYGGTHFSLNQPTNFDATTRGGSGLASVNFSGTRNDANVQVDVFDGKDVNLDKVAEQNKKAYGGRTPSQGSVGGQKAYIFNYSGGKDVASRAYFFMANNKLYRITMNWYMPQQDLYLPAFEKMLASFRAK